MGDALTGVVSSDGCERLGIDSTAVRRRRPSMTSQPPPPQSPVPSVEEAPPPRTPWKGTDVLLVFVFGIIGAVVVGSLLYPLLDQLDLTETTIETVFTLLTYIALATAAWVIIVQVRKARLSEVGLNRVPSSTLWLMVPAAFAVMIVNGFLVLVIREIFGDVATVEDQLNVRRRVLRPGRDRLLLPDDDDRCPRWSRSSSSGAWSIDSCGQGGHRLGDGYIRGPLLGAPPDPGPVRAAVLPRPRARIRVGAIRQSSFRRWSCTGSSTSPP